MLKTLRRGVGFMVSLACAGTATADLVGAAYEVVELGAPAGMTTYRLYLTFDAPDDHVISLGAQSEVVALSFSTNIGLVNAGGILTGQKEEDFAAAPVSAAWDSWVTVGTDVLADNDTNYTPGFLGGDGSNAVIVGASWIEGNGGWFDSNPLTPELPGADGRVLIAQFTVENEPDGSSDITLVGSAFWRPPGGLSGLYMPIAVTTRTDIGACVVPTGCCVEVDVATCGVLGGAYQGLGTACPDLPSTGACCLPDETCGISSPDGCAALGGTFRGADAECDATICDGACCLANGQCFVFSSSQCAAVNGVFQGSGVDCLDAVCVAACCLEDRSCVLRLPDECAAMGGTFQGAFTMCADVRCAAPCLGDIDNDGQVGFVDLLTVLSSWGPCAGCPADLIVDGDVNFEDLLVVLSVWGPC